jgi:hypothetical protein
MIASAHVLAGLICGVATLSVRARAAKAVLAFALGIGTHVILDAIPHSDYGTLSRGTIVVVVSLEVIATTALAWLLLRSRRTPGWQITLPAGVFGASIPDIKFLAPYFPPQMASMIETAANGFHAPFHAAPMRLAAEVSAELACTALLVGAMVVLARHHARRQPAGLSREHSTTRPYRSTR